MTIKKLKEQIAALPDEMEIVLQKDSEGNGFSPLAGVDPEAVYVPDSSYSGTAYQSDWDADQCDLDEDAWEKLKKQPRVLVLWPRN